MRWIGALIGGLYGSVGFGLGVMHVFCATIQTLFCAASKLLIVFSPSALLGGTFLGLLDMLPFTASVVISVVLNTLLFILLGVLVERAIRSLLRK